MGRTLYEKREQFMTEQICSIENQWEGGQERENKEAVERSGEVGHGTDWQMLERNGRRYLVRSNTTLCIDRWPCWSKYYNTNLTVTAGSVTRTCCVLLSRVTHIFHCLHNETITAIAFVGRNKYVP